jgi:hypothetical protein
MVAGARCACCIGRGNRWARSATSLVRNWRTRRGKNGLHACQRKPYMRRMQRDVTLRGHACKAQQDAACVEEEPTSGRRGGKGFAKDAEKSFHEGRGRRVPAELLLGFLLRLLRNLCAFCVRRLGFCSPTQYARVTRPPCAGPGRCPRGCPRHPRCRPKAGPCRAPRRPSRVRPRSAAGAWSMRDGSPVSWRRRCWPGG